MPHHYQAFVNKGYFEAAFELVPRPASWCLTEIHTALTGCSKASQARDGIAEMAAVQVAIDIAAELAVEVA